MKTASIAQRSSTWLTKSGVHHHSRPLLTTLTRSLKVLLEEYPDINPRSGRWTPFRRAAAWIIINIARHRPTAERHYAHVDANSTPRSSEERPLPDGWRYHLHGDLPRSRWTSAGGRAASAVVPGRRREEVRAARGSVTPHTKCSRAITDHTFGVSNYRPQFY